MKNSKPMFHGSDLELIEKHYGVPRDEIISFGANVNPLGLPESVKIGITRNLDLITRYPDREYVSLRQSIAGYCKVAAEDVVVGNGSTELISLLIAHCGIKLAMAVGPTYSEYERELKLAGAGLSYYQLDERLDFSLDMKDFSRRLHSLSAAGLGLVILCNPNNPTSSALMKEELAGLIKECRENGIFVMIDETYAEFAPHISDISAMQLTGNFDNLMVIRGVSKFFAAPGLRLGYGVTCNEQLLDKIRQYQNPWSLNSIAAFAGELMLQDHSFIDTTRSLISAERTRIGKRLMTLPGIKLYPVYANFFLIRLLKEGLTSLDVFECAIKQGMMLRDCSSFAGLSGEYLRFCIMLPEQNDRLIACLEACLID